MKVEIKERKLKTGRRSLYLEYYETGFRKKENLELYLMPDDVRGAKSHNKKVMEQAMKIRSERILTPPNFEKQRVEKEEKRATRERLGTLTWIDWCQEFVDFAIESGFVKKNIDMKKGVKDKVTKYLKRKKNTDMLLVKVTKDYIIGLYDYMRNGYRCPKKERNTKDKSGKLGDFTLMLFGQAIAAMFNKAVRDGLIEISPVELVEKKHKFGVPDTPREALTVEELKRFLAVVPTSKEQGIAQKAFGFACMTGLRLSDVRTITWSNIKEIGGQLSVTKIQQKTKNEVTVPLNELAISMLPQRPEVDDGKPIFPLSHKPDIVAKHIRRIKNAAGIEDKDITFHNSRHTAATLAISAGSELKTVSSLLGHKSIESTQVYAKVDMDKKFDAINLFGSVF